MNEILKYALYIVVGVSVVTFGLTFTGIFTESIEVAKDEFGAKSSLKKYEWFKDMANALDEKKQTIFVTESQILETKDLMGDISFSEWSKPDKEQYNLNRSELLGLKANYNNLVARYNAQSSKFNWDMYNTSELPKKYDQYISK